VSAVGYRHLGVSRFPLVIYFVAEERPEVGVSFSIPNRLSRPFESPFELIIGAQTGVPFRVSLRGSGHEVLLFALVSLTMPAAQKLDSRTKCERWLRFDFLASIFSSPNPAHARLTTSGLYALGYDRRLTEMTTEWGQLRLLTLPEYWDETRLTAWPMEGTVRIMSQIGGKKNELAFCFEQFQTTLGFLSRCPAALADKLQWKCGPSRGPGL